MKIERIKIKIRAIGVNRADVYHRQGKYPAFGLEVAGAAEDGRRIMGIIEDGGYAHVAELAEGSWMEIPAHLDYLQGAAIIEGLYTSYYNLVTLGKLRAGENVLIHGGGGGIGVVAIQMAKLMGAKVDALAGQDAKLKLVESLGAAAINYRKQEIGRDKYDLILDMLGGDYFAKNLAALKPGGRLAIIAMIKGAEVNAKISPILLKSLTVFGSMIRTLPDEVKAQIQAGFKPYVDKIKPVVDRTFGFDEIDKALDYVEAYKNVGKVVITV